MPRRAPRFRMTTLFTGGWWRLATQGTVSSQRVLRDNPVCGQRCRGAGSRNHSGFVGAPPDERELVSVDAIYGILHTLGGQLKGRMVYHRTASNIQKCAKSAVVLKTLKCFFCLQRRFLKRVRICVWLLHSGIRIHWLNGI